MEFPDGFAYEAALRRDWYVIVISERRVRDHYRSATVTIASGGWESVKVVWT